MMKEYNMEYINRTIEFLNNALENDDEIEGVSAEYVSVMKNNSLELDGVMFKKHNNNANMVFYLNYIDADGPAESAMELLKIYKTQTHVSKGNLMTDELLDWEKVKSKVIFSLVNKKNNENYFRSNNIVYKEFLDLAIIYKVKINKECYYTIQEGHLKMWGMTVDQLDKIAKENTPKIEPMIDMPMAEMFITFSDEQFKGTTFVATNPSSVFGASVMVYDDFGSYFAEKIDDDFVIIPSSVHEVIVCAKSIIEDVKEIKKMIQDVNATAVRPDEILAYHPYIYKRETGKIEIA